MVHKQIFYTSKDINIPWGQVIRKKKKYVYKISLGG